MQKVCITNPEMEYIISFQKEITRTRNDLLVQWQKELASPGTRKDVLVQLYASMQQEAHRLDMKLQESPYRDEVVQILKDCIQDKIHRYILARWDVELSSMQKPAPQQHAASYSHASH